MKPSPLLDVINAVGGPTAFVKKMGARADFKKRLLEIVNGERVPGERVRAAIIRASGGTITHEQILAISGRTQPDFSAAHKVDAHWSDDEDERRDWIISRAAAAARAQRLANEAAT